MGIHGGVEEHDAQLLGLRAVNAHVFCPRLHGLEHVEGIFVDNEHTIEGQHVHRRVDKPGGALPAPEGGEDEAPAWHARSLWWSDVALGVQGKMDLVDVAEDGSVYPVDTKKGRSRDGDLWAPDRVQLVLQALLLRSAGYRVDRVAAWYHAERRRVVVPLTEVMEAEARDAVAATHATRAGEHAPPPLVGSSRCLGCSLNGVCLPDETLRLMELARYEAEGGASADDAVSAEEEAGGGGEVRRVIPPRLDRLPLYVQRQGATVKIQKSEVVVVGRDGAEEARVGFGHLGQLNVYGQVHVTGPVIQGCLDRSIPVCFFSSGGWFRGHTRPSANRQVHVRIAQYGALAGSGSLQVARRLVADKIANQRVLLRRNRADDDEVSKATLWELKRLRDQATAADSMATLLGTEGAAAKLYWGHFSALVSRDEPAFALSGRSRRPPRDRTNSMLSYLYGMLTKDVALAVEGVGLDPHLGLYHTPHHGRPSMALDLMEPFRPLVADSVVLQMIRRGEVQPEQFVEAGQEVTMKGLSVGATDRGSCQSGAREGSFDVPSGRHGGCFRDDVRARVDGLRVVGVVRGRPSQTSATGREVVR